MMFGQRVGTVGASVHWQKRERHGSAPSSAHPANSVAGFLFCFWIPHCALRTILGTENTMMAYMLLFEF